MKEEGGANGYEWRRKKSCCCDFRMWEVLRKPRFNCRSLNCRGRTRRYSCSSFLRYDWRPGRASRLTNQTVTSLPDVMSCMMSSNTSRRTNSTIVRVRVRVSVSKEQEVPTIKRYTSATQDQNIAAPHSRSHIRRGHEAVQ